MKIKKTLSFDYLLHSGKILASALHLSKSLLELGNTPYNINAEIDLFIRNQGATPSFIGLDGFKYASCISVNEVVIHGVPKKIPLKNGDKVTVDIGVSFKNHCTDAARTFFIGRPKKDTNKIISSSYSALNSGINKAIPGNRVGDISYSIQKEIVLSGFFTPLGYGGHGIGSKPHMDPFIPNYGMKSKGNVLIEGMCLAIEPILLEQNVELKQHKDKFSLVIENNIMSSHVEDTIIVHNSPVILTRTTLHGENI